MSAGYEAAQVGGGDGGDEEEEGGFFSAEPDDDAPPPPLHGAGHHPDAPPSMARDWNEEFQTLLTRTLSNSESDVERAARLRQLCHGTALTLPTHTARTGGALRCAALHRAHTGRYASDGRRSRDRPFLPSPHQRSLRHTNERHVHIPAHQSALTLTATIDFAEEAQRIGVLIIKEMFLPPHQRRIQQRTAELGGVAGGEKFLHSNIFFKLAVDRGGLYGGDAYAKKAAEHELKGALCAVLCCAVLWLSCVLVESCF